MQTDATLLANNSQNCWMLHLVSVCTPCCMLLRKVWYWSNFSANNSQHFFCSMIAEAWRNNVGSVCTALPTLLGPHMLITRGLQRLVMGCILPTMHCRSQHCWEFYCIRLHTTANMHAKNPSCCVRLHAALGSFSVLQMNLITKWRFPKDWIDIVQFQHHFAALKGNKTSNSFHNTKTDLNWNFYFQLSTVVANTNFI